MELPRLFVMHRLPDHSLVPIEKVVAGDVSQLIQIEFPTVLTFAFTLGALQIVSMRGQPVTFAALQEEAPDILLMYGWKTILSATLGVESQLLSNGKCLRSLSK